MPQDRQPWESDRYGVGLTVTDITNTYQKIYSRVPKQDRPPTIYKNCDSFLEIEAIIDKIVDAGENLNRTPKEIACDIVVRLAEEDKFVLHNTHMAFYCAYVYLKEREIPVKYTPVPLGIQCLPDRVKDVIQNWCNG